jgi:hypothetical protein
MRGVKDLGVNHVAAIVREAAKLVDNKKYGEALMALTELPGLKFAFASKVLWIPSSLKSIRGMVFRLMATDMFEITTTILCSTQPIVHSLRTKRIS